MGSADAAATTGGGIQRIIHQIWLGSNPRPEEWIQTVRDFAREHDYEYRLWDEAAAADLPWNKVPGLRALYRDFDKEFAGKADLIRLLALYTEGGIYIDADSVVMKPAKFATFLEKNRHPVFFAWENIKRGTKGVNNFGHELEKGERERRLIANGTIGAAAGHPFLKTLLDGVVAHATKREAGEQAWRRVGPLYVTRTYWAEKDGAGGAGGVDEVHMYPMKLFYPRHWRGIRDPELHKKVRIPGDSMLFQYGYTTNKFADIFRRRATRRRTLQMARGTRRGKRT